MRSRRTTAERAADGFDAVFLVLWIGPLLVPGRLQPPGGAETQLAMIGRGLAAAGHRVCFVALDVPGGLPGEVDGISIEPIRRSARTPSLLLAMRVARALLRARGRVLVQRSAGAETGLAALVARSCGRRFVYSSASIVDFDYARLGRRRRSMWIFHLGVRLASEIVVQTPEQVSMCRERFGRKPVLITSVAATARPSTASRDAFLWVGRSAHYKRPEDFLRLAEALPEASFRMIVVPSDEQSAEGSDLRERAAALGNVEWVDPRPHDELLALMESAVAVVNTSDYEGMPNTFLEGWARGVPALSLRHDPDGVIERERLGAFAGGDFGRFVAAARDLWDGRDEPGPTGERCRAYIAANHDADVVLAQWEDALGLDPRLRG